MTSNKGVFFRDDKDNVQKSGKGETSSSVKESTGVTWFVYERKNKDNDNTIGRK